MFNLLMLVAPALGWGLMPIVAKKSSGSATDQLLGTTIAAFVISLGVSLVLGVHYELSHFIVCFFSGFFWGLGQLFQFKALNKAPVSCVMPVSTGTQLLFTTIVSGIVLSEWQSLSMAIRSLVIIAVIIFAVNLIAKSGQTGGAMSKKDVGIICLSSAFLCLYATTTGFFGITGTQVFLPQALGMVSMGLVLRLGERRKFEVKPLARNSLTGICWVVANLGLFYSSAHVGVGLAYTVSQLCLVVAIFGGIFFLKERKSIRELQRVIAGSTIFIVAVLFLSQL